jgi:hypothetical protein
MLKPMEASTLKRANAETIHARLNQRYKRWPNCPSGKTDESGAWLLFTVCRSLFLITYHSSLITDQLS